MTSNVTDLKRRGQVKVLRNTDGLNQRVKGKNRKLKSAQGKLSNREFKIQIRNNYRLMALNKL